MEPITSSGRLMYQISLIQTCNKSNVAKVIISQNQLMHFKTEDITLQSGSYISRSHSKNDHSIQSTKKRSLCTSLTISKACRLCTLEYGWNDWLNCKPVYLVKRRNRRESWTKICIRQLISFELKKQDDEYKTICMNPEQHQKRNLKPHKIPE